uniref:Putative sterol metabolic process n=2 Tax=Ornithodoros turicata TaxID=34597 RepID=A0A2R5LEI1_9ACAR
METDVALVLGIICALILILFTFLGFLGYCGLFAPIDIRAGKPPFEELKVAYKFCRGPYKTSGGLFTEVHNLAPSLKCIGMYYDDPDEVEPMQLRFLVGAILNDSLCPADETLLKKLQEEGYRTVTFPAVDNVISTTFPFRGSVSVILAVARVYPQLKEYIKEKHLCAHPFLEIYESDKVLFVCPLAKQDEFYVDEAVEDPEEGGTSDQGFTSEDQEETTVSNEAPPIPEQRIQTINSTPVEESDRASRSSTTSSFEELRLDSTSN